MIYLKIMRKTSNKSNYLNIVKLFEENADLPHDNYFDDCNS